MSKYKKIIIGSLIVLIIVIGIFFEYKVIENSVTNRTDFNFCVGNISSSPIDTITHEQNDTELNRNEKNVTIEVDKTTISSESVTIIITDNNTEHYAWGVEFRVQELIDGTEWKNLNYISNDLSWIDIAYQLNADNQLIQKLDIEKYYGKLSNGIYRIVKPVYDNGYIDIYSNEFEIK